MTSTRTPAIVLTAILFVSLLAAPMAVAGESGTDASNATAVTAAQESSGGATITAYAQQGTIVLSGNDDDPIQIPESDQDQPLPDNAPEDTDWEDESFSFEADVDREAGTWSADPEDVTFPTITVYDVNADRADVTMAAPNGLEGTFDPETGEMTFEGTLEIQAEIYEPLGGVAPDSTCVTQTEIEGTTGESEFGASGSPLEVDEESGTATATVVDDGFTVPSMEAADGLGAVCDAADDQYNLPAEEPGDNVFDLELWMELDGFDDDGDTEPEPDPAEFDVDGVETDSPVVEGDTLSVETSVTNVGDESGTQAVLLMVDGEEVDSQDVTLDGDESEAVTLEWETADGDAGEYDVTVQTADDEETVSATVEEPVDGTPGFGVTVALVALLAAAMMAHRRDD